MSSAAWLEGDALILRVYIQPKASRDKIVGLHGEALKIAITAPPIDGKANAHLIKFLAKQLKAAKGHISIEKGEQSRHKQVRVCAFSQIPPEIQAVLSG